MSEEEPIGILKGSVSTEVAMQFDTSDGLTLYFLTVVGEKSLLHAI